MTFEMVDRKGENYARLEKEALRETDACHVSSWGGKRFVLHKPTLSRFVGSRQKWNIYETSGVRGAPVNV